VNRARRWSPWIGLLVVVIVAFTVGTHRSSHPTLDSQVMHIAGEVRCPVCDGETAAQSSAAPSVEIRAQIRQELQAGDKPDQILAGLVQSYGSGILEKPQASGIGLVVWVVPVVGAVLMASALILVFGRWRKRVPGAGAGVYSADDGDDPEMAEVGASRVFAPPTEATGSPAELSEAVTALLAPEVAVASIHSSTSAGVLPSQSAAQEFPSEPGTPLLPAGGTSKPDPTVRRWPRRALVGVGVCLIAGGAGWAVTASSTARLPGETITGQALGSESVAQDLQRAQTDAAKGDAVSAIKEYQTILRADPTEVDALTAEGWLLVQTQQPSLLQQGIGLLGSAENADPDYAPSHLYRGLALLYEADYADATPEFQWYLAHDPDPTLVAQVRQDLQQAQAGAKASAPRST